jgi:hypothetical protein
LPQLRRKSLLLFWDENLFDKFNTSHHIQNSNIWHSNFCQF